MPARRKAFANAVNSFFPDVDALRIWRFEDPHLGARKIPLFNEPFKGKVKLENGIFVIDTERNEVFVETASGKKSNVGNSFIYVVE